MQLSGQSEMPATREKVWAALNDPSVLKAAIPNCTEFTRLSETEYLARGTYGDGFLKVQIDARIRLTDVKPPESLTIKLEAKGGWNTRGNAEIKVRLTELNGKTTVAFDAKGSASGFGASKVEEMLQDNAKAWSESFFKRVAEVASKTIWAPPAPPAPPALPPAKTEFRRPRFAAFSP